MDLSSERVTHWAELIATAIVATLGAFFAFVFRVHDTERQVQANTSAIAELAAAMKKHTEEAADRDIAIAALKANDEKNDELRQEIIVTLREQRKDMQALTRAVFRAIGGKLSYEDAED